jgi:hypothetical protein
MPKDTKKYTEKERAAAIQKMYRFLTDKHQNHSWVFRPGRDPIFTRTKSPQDLYNLIQMFFYHEHEIKALSKWANTHKRAFKELKPEDYKAVQDLFAVEAVHES